jgi:hypothetical protein
VWQQYIHAEIGRKKAVQQQEAEVVQAAAAASSSREGSCGGVVSLSNNVESASPYLDVWASAVSPTAVKARRTSAEPHASISKYDAKNQVRRKWVFWSCVSPPQRFVVKPLKLSFLMNYEKMTRNEEVGGVGWGVAGVLAEATHAV